RRPARPCWSERDPGRNEEHPRPRYDSGCRPARADRICSLRVAHHLAREPPERGAWDPLCSVARPNWAVARSAARRAARQTASHMQRIGVKRKSQLFSLNCLDQVFTRKISSFEETTELGLPWIEEACTRPRSPRGVPPAGGAYGPAPRHSSSR